MILKLSKNVIFPLISIIIICILFTIIVLFAISDNKSKIYGSKIYVVSVGSFDSYYDAKIFSEGVQNKGAAGYIHSDSISYVLAFAYFSKNDAVNIKNSLNEYETKLLEITFDVPKAKSDEEKKFFKFIEDLAISLYDNISAFDKGNVNSSQIIKELKLIKIKLTKYLDYNLNNQIKLGIKDLLSNFEDIFSTKNNDLKISSKLKYMFIDFLFNIQNFISSVNN